MSGNGKRTTLALLACLVFWGVSAFAQDIPSDYQDVLKSLDRKGDFKDGVLKVNIPRSDLKITVQGVATPTPFGFGGWVAFTKTTDGGEVMMGDLVLLQEEVSPVMSALLDNGIDVTALHNHFFWEDPHVFTCVHGMGSGGPRTTRKAGVRFDRPCEASGHDSRARVVRQSPPPRSRRLWRTPANVRRRLPNYGREERHCHERPRRASAPHGSEPVGPFYGTQRGRCSCW
jgi:hypothetical protein